MCEVVKRYEYIYMQLYTQDNVWQVRLPVWAAAAFMRAIRLRLTV
jgi:hypothetical protein